MLVTALIAGAVFTHRYLEQNEQHEDFFLDDPSWFKLACLALLGILMVSQQGLRNYGLSIASDSSVTVVLYAEVAFSFAFDLAVLGARPSPLQFLGAALIVIGSVLAVVLRVLARRKLENRAQVEKKGVLLPQRIGEQ
jgi:drug/metabolite transporter (DMT)-like permease